MWGKPWKMAEGFLIGGGLFVVGLALQLTIGPIDWSLFAAPVNWIMLVVLLGFLTLMFLLRKKVYAFEWMMHGQAAVAAIVWALGITLADTCTSPFFTMRIDNLLVRLYVTLIAIFSFVIPLATAQIPIPVQSIDFLLVVWRSFDWKRPSPTAG